MLVAEAHAGPRAGAPRVPASLAPGVAPVLRVRFDTHAVTACDRRRGNEERLWENGVLWGLASVLGWKSRNPGLRGR